eukprot:tig00020563_g11213.t1
MCKSYISWNSECKKPIICYKKPDCTGTGDDITTSVGDRVDDCGLETDNKFLYYNNNGTCVNRVPSGYTEYNVDEYYERNNSGPADRVARVYDSGTGKFKCCKIGADGKLSSTCSQPYSRLDEDANVAAVEEDAAIDIEEMEVDIESESLDSLCCEAELEASVAALAEAA